MSAQDKAKELISKFMPHVKWKMGQEDCLDRAKKCALVAVDEIYFGIYNYLKNTNELQNSDREFAYWENVKTEIEKF